MSEQATELRGIIDVHAHLSAAEFDGDLDAVVARAQAAGLAAVLAVGTGPDDADRVLEIASSYDIVFPCLGLHPCEVTPERTDRIMQLLEQHADAIVGVGECGLDYMCGCGRACATPA